MLSRRDPDAEIDEEFATHLALEAERQMGNGVAPSEASDAARRRFGNLLRYREDTRAVRGLVWWDHLHHDMRDALRAIRRRPIASAAAMFALAIGMGGPAAVIAIILSTSTAVFPGVRDPDRLVMISETPPREPNRRREPTPETLRVWRDNAGLFKDLSAAQLPVVLSLKAGEFPENVTAQALAVNLLPLLGVAPATGRAFVDVDARRDADQVALASHGFWQTRLGGRADVAGSTIDLDGRTVTIVGVMPRGFWFGSRGVDVWLPMPDRDDTPSAQYRVVARMHDDDDKESVAARIAALAPQIAAAQPAREAGWGIRLDGIGPRAILDDELAPGLVMLLTAAALGLIVACTNIAMVMVARGVSRQRETAVRAALGAPRGRLVRQFLTESVVVSLGGGALALLVAFAGLRLIVAFAPSDLASAITVALDSRLILSMIVVSVVIGVLSGLAPALADSRVNLVLALKNSGYFGSVPGNSRLRRVLIVAEVTVTVVLLAAVGLLARGAIELASVGPGFDAEHALQVRIDPIQHIGRAPSPPLDLDALVERLRAVNGVEAVAVVEQSRRQAVTVPALAGSAGSSEQSRATVNAVGEAYFTALGLRQIEGRPIDSGDRSGAPVAVVAEVFARRHFPGGSAIGRTLRIGQEPAERTIVGVVSNVLTEGARREPSPIVYVPYTSVARPADERPRLVLIVRHVPGASVVPDLRRAVTDLHPLQTIAAAASLKTLLDVGAQEMRVTIYLAGPILLLAMLLTMSGIYGLLAQSVTQRTHEVALRMALGAGRGDVLALVLAQGLKLTAAGAVSGTIVALMLDRVLGSFLFGVPGERPLALAGAALLIVLATLVASIAPCLRAVHIDPGRTLKYE